MPAARGVHLLSKCRGIECDAVKRGRAASRMALGANKEA